MVGRCNKYPKEKDKMLLNILQKSLKWYYDENRIFPIAAIVTHKK